MAQTLHIYTRISTESQTEGGSLDAQRESGIAKAKQLGMDYKVWDEGVASSSKDNLLNRPVLRETLQKIEDGEVKHLFVWNTDRLARDERVMTFIKYSYLIKHEVILHTPSGEFNMNDPATRMVVGVLGSVAQYENELRTIRLQEGLIRSVQRDGRWAGGAPPYGYKLEDSKLVVEPDEAKWVVRMHEMYRDNHSVDEIRDELMRHGVVTRRGKPVWSHGSITALLGNTHYDGYWIFRPKNLDGEIRAVCPPICEPQLIKQVQEAREKRSYKNPAGGRAKTSVKKHDYLLSNLLSCGHCGSIYYSNKKITQQASYYYCSQKTNKFRDKHTDKSVKCNVKRNLNLNTTDTEVWNIVKEVLSNSNLYREEVKNAVFEDQGTYTQRTSQKKKLLRKIESLERDVIKITDSVVNLTTESILTENKDTQRVVKQLEKKRLQTQVEIDELKSELTDQDTRSAWVDWLGKFSQQMDDLDSLSTKDKNEFLTGLLNKIIVYEKDIQTSEIEIHFKFPYVGDKLLWNEYDDNGKRVRRTGYTLVDGKRIKKRTLRLSKKS